jgi:hypothetical protein
MQQCSSPAVIVDALRVGRKSEMTQFRCFFVDERDTVESFEPLDLKDEAEAVRRAEEMLRARATAVSAEIWESGRLVARVGSPGR